ncbi:hypothetical protein Vadar_022086 [Vaccinium darrowii]|uniref:Uncharacterized protein n=1 Tax=Vaccinium darrowii TaxID=229202 RepID=A0ACB7YPX5_9ERIC|nr:hypothetical protein Vadar_022086 [Vaccinium darrowii]
MVKVFVIRGMGRGAGGGGSRDKGFSFLPSPGFRLPMGSWGVHDISFGTLPGFLNLLIKSIPILIGGSSRDSLSLSLSLSQLLLLISLSKERLSHAEEQNNGSLLVRNIPLDCRPEELRVPFERFGLVRDVYIPRDYHTGEPRGFAFVQFVDPYEAAEAQYHMNRAIFAGREITVVVAAETRKRPEEMRRRSSARGPSGYGGRQSRYGRSRSRSVSRSRSPRYPSGSRSRHRSRSYSPAPRRRTDYSVSPNRRQADHTRSPREPPKERDSERGRRSYSPGYENDGDGKQNGDLYGKKAAYDSDEARRDWRSSPGRASRSPSGSRSRSADLSP